MEKKTIKDIDVKGKKVLVRCDFNVPLDIETKTKITDDRRIVASLPTIEYLINEGAIVILCSHIGKTKEALSLAPVCDRLASLLKKDVLLLEEVVGDNVKQIVDSLEPGDVVLLENVRKFKEEEENDPVFSKKLAALADIYVNDAFGSAHRAHASTVGVTEYLPAVSGFLIEKELKALDKGLNSPVRPLTAIIGGSKVSSKIDVLTELLKKVDSLLIGGGMAYTFIKSLGGNIGDSIVEEDKLETAKNILELAKQRNVTVILPVDTVIAKKCEDGIYIKEGVVDASRVPDGFIGMDIGPKTIEEFKKVILSSGTVVWNGPVGVFEYEDFATGTNEIIKCLAEANNVSIIGGGDTAAAVTMLGLEDKMTHVSTGGGASLEFMEGKILPGIAALKDK